MRQMVYVSSPESQEIYVWKLDNVLHGVLTLVQIINVSGQAHPMVVHPNKQFLYVGIRPNFSIAIYHINDLGLLTNIGSIKIASSPTHLSSDKKGTFLFCASYKHNTVNVLPIKKSGLLGKPIQIIENLLGCHSTYADKNKPLLWVPCLREHVIKLFKINVSGVLTPWDPGIIKSVIDSGPRHMTTFYDNNNCYAYVINELVSTVDVIQYNYYQKTPNIIQTLSIIPRNISITQYWGSDIHITPDGHWVYCSDRVANIISCFAVSQDTKELKFVNYQATEIQPRGFAIDNSGKFLIVAGQKSNYISLYSIDINNDGRLIFLSRYVVGRGPVWVVIV